MNQNIVKAVYKNYKRQTDGKEALQFMILKEFVNRDDDRWTGSDHQYIWTLFNHDYPSQEISMLYVLFGVWMVMAALAIHMVINVNWKTGEWKGRHKGKWLPLQTLNNEEVR